eukprot:sb/3468246/
MWLNKWLLKYQLNAKSGPNYPGIPYKCDSRCVLTFYQFPAPFRGHKLVFHGAPPVRSNLSISFQMFQFCYRIVEYCNKLYGGAIIFIPHLKVRSDRVGGARQATNGRITESVRTNVLIEYFTISAPCLDQFAKSWARWKEDIELFQMSLRKLKLAQIARRHGAKCASFERSQCPLSNEPKILQIGQEMAELWTKTCEIFTDLVNIYRLPGLKDLPCFEFSPIAFESRDLKFCSWVDHVEFYLTAKFQVSISPGGGAMTVGNFTKPK